MCLIKSLVLEYPNATLEYVQMWFTVILLPLLCPPSKYHPCLCKSAFGIKYETNGLKYKKSLKVNKSFNFLDSVCANVI